MKMIFLKDSFHLAEKGEWAWDQWKELSAHQSSLNGGTLWEGWYLLCTDAVREAGPS